MYQPQPSEVTATTALLLDGVLHFPLTAGLEAAGRSVCRRVTLRGGHFYDVPAAALIRPTPHALECSIATVTPGSPLAAPLFSRRPAVTTVRYDYLANNNKGVPVRFKGATFVSPEQAELLGWLMGGGTLHADKQAVRYSSGDQAQLHRVANLCSKAFPSVKTQWYAKSSGYDITMTAGIGSPLRHFLRQMDFFEECPMAVGRYFSHADIILFLRGLWGADGHVSVKKGGNEVSFGLSRTKNEYWYSFQRMLHAMVGLEGSREYSRTTGSSRLMFSGYHSYKKFMTEIGQVASLSQPAIPVVKPRQGQGPIIANPKDVWYNATVLKVERLPTPLTTYRLGTKWMSTKHTAPPRRST